jgi:hypothetical protein
VGKGVTTSLAIQNGTSPILITGKGVEQLSEVKGLIFAEGQLIVSRHGPLVVDAAWVGTKKPPSKQSAPGGKPAP